MNYLKKYSSIILVLLLSIFTIQPLFSPGFFKVHDDTQVARVYEMKTALADGMFPVRWVPDLGYNYGYPIFNFYGPFAYYVGGFFNLLGFDSLIATKMMLGLGMLLAGVSMYLLAKEFWGKIGGIVSALLYTYAPYHALNMYVRGAIGELWAYGILPLAFFALYKIFKSLEVSNASITSKSKIKSQKSLWMWVSISAISYACIVVSHNLTAMMVTPFLFGFALILYFISRFQTNTIRAYFILVSFLIGIFLAAFYWLPVLFEMKYTNVLSVVGGGSDYKDHYVCIGQLWDSPWAFGGSAPGCIADGQSFKIGKLQIGLAFLALIPLIFYRKKQNIFYAILLSLFGAVVSVFLMLDASKFVWDAIPHMAFFQFPWRFLVLATFCLSFAGGAIFVLLHKKPVIQTLAGAVVVTAIILYNTKLFVPDKIYTITSEGYTNKSQLIWETSKISDEYMPKGFHKPRSFNEVPKRKISEQENIQFLSYSEKTQAIRADVDAKEQTELLVNIAYFPGWHVYIDNKQQEFKYFKKGLLVTIPKGKHSLAITFTQTPIEMLSNALSLTGVFILLAGIILSRKADKRD